MVAFLLQVGKALNIMPGPDQVNDVVAHLPITILLLLGNAVLGFYVLTQIRGFGRAQRLADEARRSRSLAVVDHDDHSALRAPAGD